jgi:putative DNA-invertase from lambdoid prophage Rac
VIVRTVINSMVFDGATADPMQQAVRDALIGFMAALSQAQAEVTKEAQRAGIAHARGDGDAYLGRKPSFDRAKVQIVRDMLANEATIAAIAAATGLTRRRSIDFAMTPLGQKRRLWHGKPKKRLKSCDRSVGAPWSRPTSRSCRCSRCLRPMCRSSRTW